MKRCEYSTENEVRMRRRKKSLRNLEVKISSLFQIEVVLGLKCLMQQTVNRTVTLKHICHRLLPKNMKQRAGGGGESINLPKSWSFLCQSFLVKLDLIQTSSSES